MVSGQLIVGDVVSITVTEKAQFAVLPAPSVAVQVTVVVPFGNTELLTGLHTTVAYFEHLLEFGLATTTVAGVQEGLVVQTPAQERYEPEQKVVIGAPPERVYLFDTDTGERLR